jgi:hypothetical protein
LKRNLVLGLNILTFIFGVPLLIFLCTTVGLVFYLAFNNLDAAVSRIARDSGPVRIRTIPSLAPVSPTPVTNGPIERAEGLSPVEIPSEPVLPGPLPAEETRTASETTSVQNVPAVPAEVEALVESISSEPALPDTAAGSEDTTTSAAAAAGPGPADQNEEPTPAENLPVVEVPVEPVPSDQPAPESVAHPLPPPQKDPPAPTASPESSFVPDSSFFDQLLDQVE